MVERRLAPRLRYWIFHVSDVVRKTNLVRSQLTKGVGFLIYDGKFRQNFRRKMMVNLLPRPGKCSGHLGTEGGNREDGDRALCDSVATEEGLAQLWVDLTKPVKPWDMI